MATGVSGKTDTEEPVPAADKSEAIAIMHSTYAWSNEADSHPTLSDISLFVPKGALCIVVGTVGSGKSSLLAAMLGEMHCVRGTATVDGTIAYTAQVRTSCAHCSSFIPCHLSMHHTISNPAQPFMQSSFLPCPDSTSPVQFQCWYITK